MHTDTDQHNPVLLYVRCGRVRVQLCRRRAAPPPGETPRDGGVLPALRAHPSMRRIPSPPPNSPPRNPPAGTRAPTRGRTPPCPCVGRTPRSSPPGMAWASAYGAAAARRRVSSLRPSGVPDSFACSARSSRRGALDMRGRADAGAGGRAAGKDGTAGPTCQVQATRPAVHTSTPTRHSPLAIGSPVARQLDLAQGAGARLLATGAGAGRGLRARTGYCCCCCCCCCCLHCLSSLCLPLPGSRHALQGLRGGALQQAQTCRSQPAPA